MSFRLLDRNMLLRCLTGLFLLLPALPGHALVTCIGTAQQLSEALTSASTSTDTSILIKLRTGNYAAAAGGNFQTTMILSNQNIEISGGWSGSGNGCQTKSNDAADTIITGFSGAPALFVGMASGVSGSRLHVHDLTLSNTAYSGASAACLSASVSANSEALFERLQMVQCLAPNGTNSAGTLRNMGGVLTMRDVYVRASVARSNGGLSVSTSDGGASRLSHLSITNTASALSQSLISGLYIENLTSSTTYLSNSVIWGNDPDAGTADVFASGNDINLTRVHYGKLSGVTASNIAPGTGDPGFVAYNNPRPRADSILVDSGVDSPPGGYGSFDAAGGARVIGAAVDIGAFESDQLFTDGFQTAP